MAIVWNELEAQVEGTIDKYVVCEGCRLEYAYKMTRAGVGHGASLYMLDNDGARRRASERAHRKLQIALEQEVDPIPCPRCGHFQPEMAIEARRRRLAWMNWHFLPVAMMTWLGLSFVATLVNGVVLNPGPLVPWNYFYPLLGAVGVVILLCPFVRLILIWNYDPNNETEETRQINGYVGGMERTEYEKQKAAAIGNEQRRLASAKPNP